MALLARPLVTFLLALALANVTMVPLAQAADCPKLPSCNGCGCRGGTGYRAPDGHCVGFRELRRICGAEPEKVCTFENAPNTGLNRECTLGASPAKSPPVL